LSPYPFSLMVWMDQMDEELSSKTSFWIKETYSHVLDYVNCLRIFFSFFFHVFFFFYFAIFMFNHIVTEDGKQ
jgi:hypothetical protein